LIGWLAEPHHGGGGADQNSLVLSGAPRAPARGHRGAKGKVWAPVLGVAGASRGPFWVPLVDARLRHAGYMAQHAVVGLPDVGDLEARLRDLGGGGRPLTTSSVSVSLHPGRSGRTCGGTSGPGIAAPHRHARGCSSRSASREVDQPPAGRYASILFSDAIHIVSVAVTRRNF